MKLVGLTICRNEEWVIGFTLRAALRWCDEMVVLDHASTDGTPEILKKVVDEHPGRVTVIREDNPVWEEMTHRQRTLDEGRKRGGHCFAIVDADEVLTANLIPLVRPMVEALNPGDVLNLPMICPWRSVDRYRDDDSCWSRGVLTLAFRDNGRMYWRSAEDGYDHHNRVPKNGSGILKTPYTAKDHGGVMHLQFAHWRRLRAKHYWYRMMETIRWPGRETPDELNKKYDEALDEKDLKTKPCHPTWLTGFADLLPHLDSESKPWHEDEIKTIWKRFGSDPFRGLDLPNDIIGDPYRPPHGVVQARVQERNNGPSNPWLWFCEDCGQVGVFQDQAVIVADARGKLNKIHSAVSAECRGRSLKLVSREDLKSEKLLGCFRRHQPPLIVSYYTNETYAEKAMDLIRSVRLLRLDYEIEKVNGIGTWEAAVLYKPEFIRKKLKEHHGRDIVWIDADAKVLTYPAFLMVEKPMFDISYYHMDVLREVIFGGTVFYRNCNAVASLVDEWEAETKKNPKTLDENSLAKVLKARKDIIFKTLPPEYCWVERWMRPRHLAVVPVIEQYAISRPNLVPIRMPV
jgi:hypothetical protein